jgi:hypothetical protein
MAPRPLMRAKALAAAVAILLILMAVILAVPRLLRRLKPETIDINLDRGLADCPWPAGVDKLDPVGGMRLEDRDVIVRTDERICFAGHVDAFNCFSAYSLGPVITLELSPSTEEAVGDGSPPALDPSIDRLHDNLPEALATYRRARRIVDGFALLPDAAGKARQSLDEWYAGDHDVLGGATIGFVGTLASSGLEVELNCGADIVLKFSFWTDSRWSSWDGSERRRICIHTPVEGGPDWLQPPPYSDAAIARSPFKLCPPSRWGR